MTSSPLTGASPRAVPVRPARVARPSRGRRATEAVLVVGTVLAVAAAFGPPSVARLGIAVAVASAVAACVFSWRELAAAERRHARATLEASRRHGRQLSEERERNSSVVAALTGRLQDALAAVQRQGVVIAGLRHQIFTLEGDRTELRRQVHQHDQTITSLRGTVREQDKTLREQDKTLREQDQTLREQDQTLRRLEDLRQPESASAGQADADAEVRHMPRRVRTELDVAVPEPELLDARTLDTVGIARDRQAARAAVLPNYEEDRRPA